MIATIEEGAVTEALLKELRWGRQVKETFQQVREADCAVDADKMRGHKSNALGKCVINMPAYEYFNMVNKYGHDAFSDRGFIRDFQKSQPHLSPNKA